MPWWWLIVAAAAGALAVLLLSNLTTSEKKVVYAIEPDFSADDERFERLMCCLLGPALVGGNRVTALHDGDEIFPAMLAAIRAAKSSICFETYIYWSGETGREFCAALAERARAGVPVHAVIDGVGAAKLDKALVQSMIDDGVEVQRFHSPSWRTISKINNRTHRKLLIVDGRIGFTGGVGIADQWRGHSQDSEHWRDNHYRVEGPVVAQLQSAFMDNWLKTAQYVLHGDAYFPRLDPVGDQVMQLFKSSPDEGSESVRLMYLLAISAARRSLDIANAYFVPDDLSREALIKAAKRGVRIRVILPGEIIDTHITRRASRSRWGPMLEAGIEIYEFQPTMFHCKVMIVDSLWVSVGSTNFDSRSFRLNSEANLNVRDQRFAAEQSEVFEADLARARRVTLDAWRHRPQHEKLIEHAASLVRSQV
ncbi:MAG TPA: phospholipase D-like domain-containing protein [Planctomycetota bacterium]|nr:phospholipase D-like domain-containing protein [Planctomycetota bacterium]